MHDEAAHIEVSRAAGVEAVEARLLKPCCKSLASLSSRVSCKTAQLGGIDMMICWGIQWSIIICE